MLTAINTSRCNNHYHLLDSNQPIGKQHLSSINVGIPLPGHYSERGSLFIEGIIIQRGEHYSERGNEGKLNDNSFIPQVTIVYLG